MEIEAMRVSCAKAGFIVACVAAFPAWGQVPQQLSYQGRLLKADGIPETGNVSIRFALFGTETGGTAVWSETKDVGLTDGFYSVFLGDTAPFPAATFGGDLWLEITVQGAAMSPRQRILCGIRGRMGQHWRAPARKRADERNDLARVVSEE